MCGQNADKILDKYTLKYIHTHTETHICLLYVKC